MNLKNAKRLLTRRHKEFTNSAISELPAKKRLKMKLLRIMAIQTIKKEREKKDGRE